MAYSYVFTVNGDARTAQKSFSVTKNTNAINTASASFAYDVGETKPTKNQAFVVTRDGTVIFAGVIDTLSLADEDDDTVGDRVIASITAKDYNVYPSWREDVYGDRPEETLKARLTWFVVSYLADYGVTLSASQADGPTIPARTYNNEKGDDVLGELTSLSAGLVRSIDADKVAIMQDPADVPAPFDLEEVDGVIANVDGPITVTPTQQNFANRCVVRYDASTAYTDTWTAEDGQTDFALSAVHSANDGVVTVNGVDGIAFGSDWSVVQVNGASLSSRFAKVFGNWTNWNSFRPFPGGYDGSGESVWVEAVAAWGDGSGGENWNENRTDIYSPSGWALRYAAGQPVGTTISFAYRSTLKAVATAEDAVSAAAIGPRVKGITAANVADADTAQALADAVLEQLSQDLKKVSYTTRTAGLDEGMTQHIATPRFDLDGDFIVSSITEGDHGEEGQTYFDVELIEGPRYQPVGAKSDWDGLIGQAVGVGSAGVSTSVSTTVTRSGVLFSAGGDATRTDGTHGMPAAGGGAIGTSPLQPVMTESSVTVVVCLRAPFDAGVGVWARLYDLDAAAYFPGTSPTITNQQFERTTFGASTVPGHRAELHLFCATAGVAVQGAGWTE